MAKIEIANVTMSTDDGTQVTVTYAQHAQDRPMYTWEMTHGDVTVSSESTGTTLGGGTMETANAVRGLACLLSFAQSDAEAYDKRGETEPGPDGNVAGAFGRFASEHDDAIQEMLDHVTNPDTGECVFSAFE